MSVLREAWRAGWPDKRSAFGKLSEPAEDPTTGRGAVFSIEQLERHATAVASDHKLDPGVRREGLVTRLLAAQQVIAQCHDLTSRVEGSGARLTAIEEWLLDNHPLVDEQISLARRHLPRGYSHRLPRLAGGEHSGMPRIYGIAMEYVAHSEGCVDDEGLSRFVSAYQSVTCLDMRELWAVGTMLRLALIEILAEAVMNMVRQRAQRDRALEWTRRLDASFNGQGDALLVMAAMVREGPVLSTTFVTQFIQSLAGRGASHAFVLAWLEEQLANRGQTIDEVVRAEGQGQAADQALMAHTIASLRHVGATDWQTFVERASTTEAILVSEAAGIHGLMDFETRDRYRHAVENVAQRLNLSEEEVARAAVSLADTRHATQPDTPSAHVGFHLLREGRPHLERALRGDAPVPPGCPGARRRWTLLLYLGSVGLITAATAAWLVLPSRGIPSWAWPLLAVAMALAASQCALSLVNWVASLLRKPSALPRMDFEHGIPRAYRTVVVVPTLLLDLPQISRIVESLELRYLANRDTNLWFALLTDFGDAPDERTADDEALLRAVTEGIDRLNEKYDSQAHGQFLLLHRPRLYNPQEGCWMGRERKRGKLEDFNALLCGRDSGAFVRTAGQVSELHTVRYVITLDTDTDLPWGAGWRLVAAAAHPLNRPQMDSIRRRPVAGYAILQPRVSMSLRSAGQSHYARLLAGEVGLDPYTREVSDVYQDLFSETSYIGKGIYDVAAFRGALDGRFPDNAVLSHDLLECCYARAGQVSDVELIEESPSGYLADIGRRHRWMRGDWQLLPWLTLRVSDATSRRLYPALEGLGWWRIFDNLRRSLVAPAYTLLLSAGWLLAPGALPWTLAVVSLLLLPELLPGIVELTKRPRRLPRAVHLAAVLRATVRRLARTMLWLTFLPFEAFVALDAASRALWRTFYSRRRMLQWQTAEAVERESSIGIGRSYRRMWVGPTLAGAIASWLVITSNPQALAVAAPFLLLWLTSPLLAWWISQPLPENAAKLSADDIGDLRHFARLTWRYFEAFVNAQENWLPPDNIQEEPNGTGRRIAHRTSPTNMGMALVANLSAQDLGYLTVGQLLDRTTRALDSMEQLARHRGHFFNWYDTRTRKPLMPLYVSTVDSGNLVGHARVLRSGLLELPDRPIWPAETVDGLHDTLRGLTELGDSAEGIAAVKELLQFRTDSLSARAAWLRELAREAERLAEFHRRQQHHRPEAAWWAGAFEQQVKALLADLTTVAPWLEESVAMPDEGMTGPAAELDRAQTLHQLRILTRQAASTQTGGTQPPAQSGGEASDRSHAEAVRLGAARIDARLASIEELARRCEEIATADFGFLYDERRKLLAIGYRIAERQRDASCYDLLASEARLASYMAIAAGQIPFEHWFALGRRLTVAAGKQALLSWSGSMFEYLMPRLVMPEFEGTLLDQTCRAVVARQIEYGRQQGTPWGISESCFNRTDAEGTFQYRAFGVPGLGLQRGLGNDLVISPYASTLALLVDPARALANLRRMKAASFLGRHGFYEAVDFTESRTSDDSQGTIVPTFMAHHHGMSLLALSQSILGPRMQQRFLANPDLRAAALLLQERVPNDAAFQILPPTRNEPVSLKLRQNGQRPRPRVLTHPNAPIPEIHLLSNGRYHVMVSAAGGGYSRWNDLEITRWREDPTCESHGVFCFFQDPDTQRVWSNSFQPTLRAGGRYDAVFSPGRVEIRRQDDGIATHTEIAVSPDDDVEIRRVRLTNSSQRPRTLVMTAYAEVVLAPRGSDQQHRAFSNLFVQTEAVAQSGAILVTRRARSKDEQPPWAFALLRESSPSGQHSGTCSLDTDRARFIGRDRSLRHPMAMEDSAPLTGATGTVLDPCVALRLPLHLALDQQIQVDLVLGVAPTRAEAMALIAKYQDPRMADRALETAPWHSRSVLEHVGANPADARRFEELAAAVISPIAVFRAPGTVLRRNRKGQSGLWRYAISGDLPIVLLHVRDAANLQLVRDLLRAHAYWRMCGLTTDLILCNESASGYRRDLDEQLLALIAEGTETQLLDKPGGVFLREGDSLSEEDRSLLQAVARIVFRDTDGSLEQQLERRRQAVSTARPKMLRTTQTRRRRTAHRDLPKDSCENLLFDNGTGGFTSDGREYVIDLPPGRPTPAPWVNVIANPKLGTVVSESGSAYTWYGNAQLFRLTPWSDDAVVNASGENLFVRSEPDGNVFTPTPGPGRSRTGHTCRHGFGYSTFDHTENGLDSRLTTFVAVEAPVKFMVLRLKNRTSSIRSLSILASMDLVLGDTRSRQGMHVVTELEPLTGAIVARNSYSANGSTTVAFLDCSEPRRSVSGDRAEVLGRNGDPASPAALRLQRLSGRLGPALDPCAAMMAQIELAPGASREVVFVLGAGRNTAEVVELTRHHRTVAGARVALEEVRRFWSEKLGVLHASTPDPAMDILVNGWLPYQALSCRMWGRSGFYQSGGAYGFRDQLQDGMALLHEAPKLAREHILRCAGRQFVEGDVQHWWHPPGGHGVRTNCSDDYLWLPCAVAQYVAVTGDTSVLEEPVPFLAGRSLEDGEESYYDLPGRSQETGSLYEHCVRSLAHSTPRGAHGLPLIGAGDWNDGMNRVGHGGRGESVWLGFFLHHVSSTFAVLADQQGDPECAAQCRRTARILADRIEEHAWDGEWYRRAWFDDGTPLGSARSDECTIDSLPQSWATIANVGDPERRRRALDAMWQHLVNEDDNIMRLFTPPFDRSALDPGYIKGYPPGVRENGGQYTHAAVWAAWALALAGRTDQAGTLLSLINPIHHTLDATGVEHYAVEPYVLAADVYAQPPRAGRGGWTWYTGSAAWLYRLMHEVIFGIRREANTLRFSPRVPTAWTHFTLHYRYKESLYVIEFRQVATHEGPGTLTLDGHPQAEGKLILVDDGREHAVEVRFGPATESPPHTTPSSDPPGSPP
ncbi:MAG: cyclic beta 1-2 glucan synthetase [Deltaproteobacteria bacterium]|nr:MAG: cyclic beta 1-2 glucan synthetase [Deltaproteobacteria bacterium]